MEFSSLSKEDESRAAQAVAHFHTWTNAEIKKALNWSHRAHYYSYKAERMFASIGILGFRGSSRVMENSNARMRAPHYKSTAAPASGGEPKHSQVATNLAHVDLAE